MQSSKKQIKNIFKNYMNSYNSVTVFHVENYKLVCKSRLFNIKKPLTTVFNNSALFYKKGNGIELYVFNIKG